MLAAQMLALGDAEIAARVKAQKQGLAGKIVKANQDLAAIKYEFKTN